jgi:hypothetical protein
VPDEALAPEIQLAPIQAEEAMEELDSLLENRVSPEVQQMIERMMAGTEPLPRELKYYENDKFGPQHINIATLRAAGFRNKEICKVAGMIPSRVSQILCHPYAKKLIAALVPQNAMRVLDIRTRMEGYASEFLDHLADLTLASEDLGEVRQASFGLLDRIGHGPLNKSVSATVHESHPLNRLATAMEESNRVNTEVMPNFVSRRPPEEGSLPADIGVGTEQEPVSPVEGGRSAPLPQPISKAQGA